MATTAEQFARYGRQMLLPEIGPSGQALLEQADVYFTGNAHSANVAGCYLAAAGIGGLGGVVDVAALRSLRPDLRSATKPRNSARDGAVRTYSYEAPSSDAVLAWVLGPTLALKVLREVVGAPLSLIEELEREIG